MTRPRYRLRDLRVTRVDVVDRGANQEAHILLAKRDAHIVLAKGRNNDVNRRTDQMSNEDPWEGLTREEIEDIVNDAARELVDEGREADLETAAANIWEDADGAAYNAYRAARSEAIAKAHLPQRPQTCREWSYSAIKKRAEVLSLKKGNWSKSAEELINEVLLSAEGSAVYAALGASHLATQPAAEVVGQIRKSAAGWTELSEAVAIATRWLNG